MKNLTEKTMNDYYTKYPEYITVSEDYWVTSSSNDYEIIWNWVAG